MVRVPSAPVAVALLAACPATGPTDTGADTPACADIEAAWAEDSFHPDDCAGAPVVFGLRFVDEDGADVGARVAVTSALALAFTARNPGTEAVSVESPDCVLKEVTYHGARGTLYTILDCFEPSVWEVGPGETAVYGSSPVRADDLGVGPVTGTATFWYQSEDELRTCRVCADGPEVVTPAP